MPPYAFVEGLRWEFIKERFQEKSKKTQANIYLHDGHAKEMCKLQYLKPNF